MAPVGVQTIFHEDKEIGLSSACSEIGVPFILSTASSTSIEEVAQASGKGPRWFQLYWPKDNDVTLSLLRRAKENGFTALVVTLDTWAMAWRPADLDAGYIPFIKGIGNQIGFSDPVFRAKFEKKYGGTPEEKVLYASQEWVGDVFSGTAHSWEDIALLRENWHGPIILKGIQHPDDARLAVQHGCDGIIVSNHGGSWLPSTLICQSLTHSQAGS
jgi:lactate 2-monooxygenase